MWRDSKRTAIKVYSLNDRHRQSMSNGFFACLVLLVAGAWANAGHAYTPEECPSCAQWNVAQAPFQVYGNTYYVGTQGLSVILITSPQGHVLIDGALPESVALVAANIRSLGFRVEDVKLIFNSHVHSDHAGGIAGLQHLSHARIVASKYSAKTLATGKAEPGDPQYGTLLSFPNVPRPEVLHGGQIIKLGELEMKAYLTPGHTRGGTTWTWRSCQQNQCRNIVYADSLTAVSAPGFKFSDGNAHPDVLAGFEHSFSVLESLPCDVLLTPHPEASQMWQKLEQRLAGKIPDPFQAPGACKRYAEAGRAFLAKRLAAERQGATH